MPQPDLSDDSLPVAAGLFPTPTKKWNPKQHKEGTRRGLALTALIILLAFYAALLGMFALQRITLDELTALIAAFSGIQTLASVAFAFYFAKG